MLSPKRTKFRKQFKGRIHGPAKAGTSLNFGTVALNNPNYVNVFLVKYDSSGNVIWGDIPVGSSSTYGGSYGTGVNASISGNIFVSGYFGGESSLKFGGVTITCDSPYDAMFVAKYSNTYNAELPKVASNGMMSLYPNPAADALNVQFEGFATSVTDISICDIMGRKVVEYSIPFPATPIQHIHLPALADGVYILKATGADGVDCLRFVVKR